MKETDLKEFWITNKSPRDVMLGDLGYSIKAYSSANLLDKKHFHFSLEQILRSASTGSLFKKRNLVAIRKLPPNEQKNKISLDHQSFSEPRSKSIFEIKQEKFAELDLTDEQFAEENSS